MDNQAIIKELISIEAQSLTVAKRCQRIRQALQPLSKGRSKKEKGLPPEVIAKFIAGRAKTRLRAANKINS